MKCYIYKIVNKVTKEKYVGQTTNFSRRIQEHKKKLKENRHPNFKLQKSWNKYGEENFDIIKDSYDFTKEELNIKEIEEIEKEQSYKNGFNLTVGGDGGNTRGNLTFEQYCFAYFGNKKHQWLLNRTGKFLGVDGSIIAKLVKEESYLWYNEKALALTEKEKEKYISDFEEKIDIINNLPKPVKGKLNLDEIIIFLSIVSVYGRGAEAAITQHMGISKGLKNHIVKGSYSKEVLYFKELDSSEIEQIAENFFLEKNLQQYVKNKIMRNKEIISPL